MPTVQLIESSGRLQTLKGVSRSKRVPAKGRSRRRNRKRAKGGKKGQLVEYRGNPGAVIPYDRNSKMTSVASAYMDDSYRAVGKFATSVAPPAEDYKIGTRMIGCDVMASIGSTNSSSALFTGYPAGYGNGSNAIVLHPINFPRLATMALTFTKYLFREICLEYTPLVGTTTGGGFAVGFSPDGQNSSEWTETVMTNVMSLMNNFMSPWWKPACLAIKLFQKRPYFTVQDSNTTVPNLRLSNQGMIYGAPNTTGSSTTVNGILCVKYVVDFYGPQPVSSGLTLFSRQALLGQLDLKRSKSDTKPPSPEFYIDRKSAIEWSSNYALKNLSEHKSRLDLQRDLLSILEFAESKNTVCITAYEMNALKGFSLIDHKLTIDKLSDLYRLVDTIGERGRADDNRFFED